MKIIKDDLFDKLEIIAEYDDWSKVENIENSNTKIINRLKDEINRMNIEKIISNIDHTLSELNLK